MHLVRSESAGSRSFSSKSLPFERFLTFAGCLKGVWDPDRVADSLSLSTVSFPRPKVSFRTELQVGERGARMSAPTPPRKHGAPSASMELFCVLLWMVTEKH